MQQEHLLVPRSARIARLGSVADTLREVWIVCHGYGQLAARFLRTFEPLAGDGTRLIIAPEALNRFYLDDRGGVHGPASAVGATWMTREDRLAEIEDYVRYLDLVLDHVLAGGPDRGTLTVTALGFSQGAATVCRWAARGRVPPDHLVLWAGRVPPELEIHPGLFRRASLTLIFGDQDEYASEAAIAAEVARLRTGGLEHRLRRFAGGHRLDRGLLLALADGA